jgi:hypothetical protein
MPVGEAGSSAGSGSIHRGLDAGQQVARREYPDPARDQLDGQRQAIDLPADPANHLGIGWSEGVARSKHRRPVDEKVGCISLTQLAVHVAAQGWNGVYVLDVHVEWRTARRQHPQTRATGQQPSHELSARCCNVLAVVEQQQRRRIPQRSHQCAEWLVT